MTRLSIIIPALNEAGMIANTLAALQPLCTGGHELIVVDGGSTDGTVGLATPLADRVLTASRGRARQMNAGAAVARGDVFWFLHADTVPPPDAAALILECLERSEALWGRFDVRLSGRSLLLRTVECLMNLRSRLTGIATGDQAIFVRREVFERVGGFPEIGLMEDVALSRTLKRQGRPLCLHRFVVTSSRRWERRGVLRTILLMWGLRLGYFMGVRPEVLARWYR